MCFNFLQNQAFEGCNGLGSVRVADVIPSNRIQDGSRPPPRIDDGFDGCLLKVCHGIFLPHRIPIVIQDHAHLPAAIARCLRETSAAGMLVVSPDVSLVNLAPISASHAASTLDFSVPSTLSRTFWQETAVDLLGAQARNRKPYQWWQDHMSKLGGHISQNFHLVFIMLSQSRERKGG